MARLSILDTIRARGHYWGNSADQRLIVSVKTVNGALQIELFDSKDTNSSKRRVLSEAKRLLDKRRLTAPKHMWSLPVCSESFSDLPDATWTCRVATPEEAVAVVRGWFQTQAIPAGATQRPSLSSAEEEAMAQTVVDEYLAHQRQ